MDEKSSATELALGVADKLRPEVSESLTRLSALSSQEAEVTTRIQQVLKNAASNKKEIDDLEFATDWHVWTFGKNVIDNEKTFGRLKDALVKVAGNVTDVVSAQRDAEMVIAKILKFQHDIGEEMKLLLGFGVANIHACRFVEKEIMLRLNDAKDGEISSAERQHLNDLLAQLEQQERHFSEVASLGDKVSENREAIENLKVAASDHDLALDSQRKKDVEHDVELEKHDEELKRQRKKDDKHDEELEKHDIELERLSKNGDDHDIILKELSERVTQLEHCPVPMWFKASIVFSVIASICALAVSLVALAK